MTEAEEMVLKTVHDLGTSEMNGGQGCLPAQKMKS